MASPLLSTTQLANLRKVGRGQMITPILVFRPSVITVSSPGYNPAYDYGDSYLTDPVYNYGDGAYPGAAVDQPEGVLTDGVLKVWFMSRLTPELNIAEAQLATTAIHNVRAPVGADILEDDIIRAVDTGEEYIVSDTNRDDSWPEVMKLTVRNRE